VFVCFLIIERAIIFYFYLVPPSLRGLPLKNDNYSYKAAKLKRKNAKRLTNSQKKFQVFYFLQFLISFLIYIFKKTNTDPLRSFNFKAIRRRGKK
jgi:hypothetical protein